MEAGSKQMPPYLRYSGDGDRGSEGLLRSRFLSEGIPMALDTSFDDHTGFSVKVHGKEADDPIPVDHRLFLMENDEVLRDRRRQLSTTTGTSSTDWHGM